MGLEVDTTLAGLLCRLGGRLWGWHWTGRSLFMIISTAVAFEHGCQLGHLVGASNGCSEICPSANAWQDRKIALMVEQSPGKADYNRKGLVKLGVCAFSDSQHPLPDSLLSEKRPVQTMIVYSNKISLDCILFGYLGYI